MNTVQPTQIVILGGTGDLTRRKLLPALLDLYNRKMLPELFQIIGLANSPLIREQYLDFVREVISDHEGEHEHTTEQLESFCSHINYVSADFNDSSTYSNLATTLDTFDNDNNTRANRLFYLAVPPTFYEQIVTDLSQGDISDETDGAWTHILVEKPFGHDHNSAQQLDTKIAGLFNEEQIFRIDHYLAKEAVQNILSFRFANTLLKSNWDNTAIESISINMSETIDVGERAGFYEDVGALRDVGQNHLLQLLALVAMDEPENFTVANIRNNRAETLSALKPISKDEVGEKVLRAQYSDYVCSDKISDDSQTETYFELITEINTPKWAGVPFYIRAGKALDVAEVSITVTFKDVATGLFETSLCKSAGNKIKLTISPEQIMSITLNAKAPGLGYQLETRTLSFDCQKDDLEIKNSYEKVLYDAIISDQTLFTTTKEVLAAWKYITPILDHWQQLPVHAYTKGSEGPENSIIPKT